MLKVGHKARQRVATSMRPEQHTQPPRGDLKPDRMPDMEVDRIGLPLAGSDFSRYCPETKRLSARKEIGHERRKILDVVRELD